MTISLYWWILVGIIYHFLIKLYVIKSAAWQTPHKMEYNGRKDPTYSEYWVRCGPLHFMTVMFICSILWAMRLEIVFKFVIAS